ncbi:PD40 domain-containing protein [candidate division KSB1 bacterium]|nr:PD40 domain-containing protein [candidate division KSB1 bacterium]
MKALFWRILLLIMLIQIPVQAIETGRFMIYPDICGDKIIFTYEDDLWLTSLDNGIAVRITTYPGNEYAAKFSPDGKWIAFTGSYQGNTDVYLIPAEGGTPTRITYLPNSARTVGWTPDSKSIVFSSFYDVPPASRDPKLFKVSIDGDMPESLPVDRGVSCSFSSDGGKMLYVRRGREDYYWKRYKGGRYPDIWMTDFKTGTFTPMTTYVGKNAYPIWIGDTMFFLSDRGDNGISNIYAYDLVSKAITAVTTFSDFDVMTPSSDGSRIIFMYNGFIHVFDPKSSTTEKITVQLHTDNWKVQPRWINPKEYIHDFDIGNAGKNAVLTARGDIFRLAIKTDDDENVTTPVNLSQTSGSRERYARLSPDGKTVAFFSDRSGEYQLYTVDISGGFWTQLTENLNCTVYQLQWSPDSKKILFGNKKFELFYIDIEKKKLKKIDESNTLDNDEFTWEISDYAWSPDSRWVAYSFTCENRNNAIYLYDTQQNQRVRLTGDFYDNLNPRWDADGGYLYFLSNRNYEISMDLFEDNHIVWNPTKVMAVLLRKGDTPPFADAATDDDENDSEKEHRKEDEAQKFRVNIDGIQERIYPLPIEPGNYFHLKAGKGAIGWSSVERFSEDEYEEFFNPGGKDKWEFKIFSMENKETVNLKQKISEAQVSINGEQLILKKQSKIYTTTFKKAFKSKKLGKELNLSGMAYYVEPYKEWNQIFSDAWRWYRDFFYDKNMHGRDWKKMGETYRAYLKDIKSRDQLNWVLSQMVGELCVSHTYIWGGDDGPETRISHPKSVASLGVDWAADEKTGLYRFEKIYGPTPYFTDIKTPLCRPDIELKEGDYLLAINGQKIKAPANIYKLLQVTKNEAFQITVNDKPVMEGAKTYKVKPIRSERAARYARWVSDNIETVLKETNGDVGYMHITAMGGNGIMQFDKFWRAFRYKKGLIIDVRGNGGGWTEYFMIDKLERRQIAYDVLQGMEPYRYPNPASSAHFVIISNENNGSDGEAFVEHFKARKLGTVVGVPSWGGLVGIINGQKTIDNGTVHQSNNAFYGEEGKWLVENHGADPDIYQDNDPASVIAGKDLQLQKAIEVALKKIKEDPFVFPAVPDYPRK